MENRITVRIDPDLEDLIPGFLENRRADVEKVRALAQSSSFADIRMIAHSMKGAGGGYGFDEITVIGGDVEEAALSEDRDAVLAGMERLSDYLSRIDVVFED